MHVQIEPETDVVVEHDGASPAVRRVASVVVDGELDIAAVPRLLELARAALDPGTTSVVLELSAVEFLDCSGLRGLVAARSLLVAAGCEVTVSRPSPAVTRLLEWTATTALLAPVAPAPVAPGPS